LKTCGHSWKQSGLKGWIPQVENLRPLLIAGSEGLPVPREPAYVDQRSQDGEAQATSE
jgi:hypothetical protein